jgi:hypothetical protein
LGGNRFNRPDTVQQFRSGNERQSQAGNCQDHAAVARIVLHVVDAALNGTDGYGICDEKGLKAGLDDKQSADLAQFDHRLIQRHTNGGVPPFPD